jgi:hypothetical protein
MLKGLYRNFIEQKTAHLGKLQQEFCLLITIKDPAGSLNIYDETMQKLETFNFWHSGINLSSRVSVRN